MPTFRNFKDSRDGRVYQCVLMPDGKWWSSTDYRWDGSQWISPPNNYYWDSTLASARLYLRSTLAVPPRTHLPTVAEINALTTATGTTTNSKPLRSALGWVSTQAGTDDYGFGMIGANGRAAVSGWGSTGYSGVLLCSDGLATTSGGSLGLTAVSNPTPPDYYASVKFIVDDFGFDPSTITSASNFQLQTANSQFQSESKGYRTLGSHGLPIITANIVWDLATANEEASFRNWFDAKTPWNHDNFPGIGNVTIQAKGLPKYTRSVRGLSISLDVAIFPNAVTPTITFPEFPTLVIYTGIEAGYSLVSNRAVVSTSGRTSLRTPIGERGETYDISWKTNLAGAIQFREWFASIGNGRKQFFASICGKTGWLWKIVGSYRFDIDVDMVRISMSVNGRDVRRGVEATLANNVVTTATDVGGTMFAYIADTQGVTYELDVMRTGTNTFALYAKDTIPVGRYRLILCGSEGMTNWLDTTPITVQIEAGYGIGYGTYYGGTV